MVFAPPSAITQPAALWGDLIDQTYTQQIAPVVQAIFADTYENGQLARRLDELDDEAAQLAADDADLTPDNAVVRALEADMEDATRRQSRAMDLAAAGMIGASIDIALQFMNDTTGGISVSFNQPDPAARAELVRLSGTQAWRDELSGYRFRVQELIRSTAVRGFQDGLGPIRIAQLIRQRVENYPMSQANNLMRTLLLQSSRRAQAITEVANSDILSHKVRLSALDGRVCLACLALHGTRLRLGEIVEDHPQGRCFSVTVVQGDNRQYETGQSYWDNLTPEQQMGLAGEANYNALSSGAVTLRDFVEPYQDPLFGSMLREASLRGILGDSAEQYYARNQ